MHKGASDDGIRRPFAARRRRRRAGHGVDLTARLALLPRATHEWRGRRRASSARPCVIADRSAQRAATPRWYPVESVPTTARTLPGRLLRHAPVTHKPARDATTGSRWRRMITTMAASSPRPDHGDELGVFGVVEVLRRHKANSSRLHHAPRLTLAS